MRAFFDLSAAVKLVSCFGLMALMLLVVGLVGLDAASESDGSVSIAYGRDIEGVDLAHRIEMERVKMARSYLQGILATDDAGREKALREVREGDATISDLLPKLRASLIVKANAERCDEAGRELATYTSLALDAVRASATDQARAKGLMAQASPVGRHISETLGEVLATKRRVAEEARIDAHARYVHSRNIVVGITLLAIVFALACSSVLGRAFAGPLRRSLAVLDRVAAGDLSATLDVESQDEVGQMASSLNRSLASIRSTMVSVRGIAREVTAVASELATSSERLSSGAQEQAASLEETAASLEEISATVKQNADNAQQAADIAGTARDAADRGGNATSAAVSAMTEIIGSSRRIGDIIATIDEIAFQTNLLALNAAVEAARAGEQGRGFAVVAAEVRTLAQRTGAAAKEIRGLIGESSGKVEDGTAKVNRSGETLKEIVRSVSRVASMVREIAAASQEQNTGVDQVNSAVSRIDEVTQANAAQTEELSTTAATLSTKAVALEKLLAVFQLGDGAGPATRVPWREVAPGAAALRARRAA